MQPPHRHVYFWRLTASTRYSTSMTSISSDSSNWPTIAWRSPPHASQVWSASSSVHTFSTIGSRF
jgi:hypothetical protein